MSDSESITSVSSEEPAEEEVKVEEPKPKRTRAKHKKKVTPARLAQLARAREVRKQRAMERKIKNELKKDLDAEKAEKKKKRKSRKKKKESEPKPELRQEGDREVEYVKRYKGKPKKLYVIDADAFNSFDIEYDKTEPKPEPVKPPTPQPPTMVVKEIPRRVRRPPAYLSNDETLRKLWLQMNG